jgi:hypothetical protein
MFVSIIAAEAGAEPELAWEAVGHVIMNRLNDKRDSWVSANNVKDIITVPAAFSGYNGRNYLACMEYLRNRTGDNLKYESIISVTIPIYNKEAQDIIDGAVLYYSPKSMTPKYSKPSWNFDQLTEIFVDGIAIADFRFYKYK